MSERTGLYRGVTEIWRNPKARLGLIILGGLGLCALAGPLIFKDSTASIAAPHLAPCGAHWLGTTGQGQDVWAQTLVGARPTLLVGFTVGLLVTLMGALIGVTSGYIGGWIDELMMAFVNVFLVIPGLPLAIILAAYLPVGALSMVAILTFTGWAWTARVVRAQTLTLRDKDFIKSARVVGEPLWRIVFIELLPHMASLLLSLFIGTTIYAIGAQVGLEFLGLGDMGSVTWGTNLYWAANDQALLTRAWWTYVPTGLGIALVGFSLALVNFGLDEVTNPRLSVDRVWRVRLGLLEQFKRRGDRFEGLTPYVDLAVLEETSGARLRQSPEIARDDQTAEHETTHETTSGEEEAR